MRSNEAGTQRTIQSAMACEAWMSVVEKSILGIVQSATPEKKNK